MTATNLENLLVVSSDTQVIYLLERILTPTGYTTQVAGDKAAALKAFPFSAPRLAIVSESLSNDNGLDVASALLERFPALPILMLTYHETPELLKNAMQIGLIDCLVLPLRADELIQAVQRGIAAARRREQWVMLEARRATASLQQQVDELGTMSRLGRSITASLDLDSVLAAVVDAAVELTGAEEGSLLLLDEATGELYMRAARNFQEEFVRSFRLPVQDSLAGQVVLAGKPYLLDEKTPQKIKTTYLVQGLIYVPLQIHGSVIGVLGIDNRQSQTTFSQRQIKLMEALADYAVIAIENAHLYSDTAIERTKLETILTNILDGVIVLDTNRQILLVNQAARSILNLPAENLLGRPAEEILTHPEILELILPSNPALPRRVEVTSEDGRLFYAQCNDIPEIGTAITLHDFTYYKKIDRIKNDFISNISHDLRSPLTAILGYVELLERVGPINEMQREFVHRVQVSVHNITTLVDDLLHLGRIETGFDARKEAFDLLKVIMLAVESFERRVSEHGATISLDLPPQLPFIFGNLVQIRQLVERLIDNGLRFTRNQGKVRVSVSEEDAQLILRVQDNGEGIAPEDLPFIFDKFFRAGSLPPEAAGTGLGLAIVKSIVEGHHGRIWVQSSPEEGTTFTIVLPISAEA
jgi:two-component system NtrC family sensor kinase